MVVAILIAECVFMISNIATGKFIRYPPIDRGDNPPRCDPNYPGSCQPPQPVICTNQGVRSGQDVNVSRHFLRKSISSCIRRLHV
ncbi:hypothetical protein YC2023_063293 [Brassica napus]